MRRSRLCAAALAALAVAVAQPAPASAFVAPPAGNLACHPSLAVDVRPGLQPVANGQATVECPTPGGRAGEPFGPTGASQTPVPPPAGLDCGFKVEEPVRWKMGADHKVLLQWTDPAPGNLLGGGPNFVDAEIYVYSASDAVNDYMQAGTADFHVPYYFAGVTDGRGGCVPKPPVLHPWDGWSSPCQKTITSSQLGCMGSSAYNPGASPQPPPLIGVPGWAGVLQGKALPGTIRALPAQNSLVNLDTCYYIDGMSIPTEQWFQVVSPSDPDATGRRVFFVFVIHVFFQGVTFNFGDGDTGAGNTGTLPDPCRGQPEGVWAVHRYLRYTPTGQPYRITATEHYGVDARVVWNDWNGNHDQPADMAGVPQLNPVTDPPLPVTVVQEEGVPVG